MIAPMRMLLSPLEVEALSERRQVVVLISAVITLSSVVGGLMTDRDLLDPLWTDDISFEAARRDDAEVVAAWTSSRKLTTLVSSFFRLSFFSQYISTLCSMMSMMMMMITLFPVPYAFWYALTTLKIYNGRRNVLVVEDVLI